MRGYAIGGGTMLATLCDLTIAAESAQFGQEAAAMGLVNKVVPDDQLDAEVDLWCREILERSPTAIAIVKRSFNADTDSLAEWRSRHAGAQALLRQRGIEGSVRAFNERRKPDFRKYVR